jgi:RNA polymerase sigma-70 factor (ECF subfamily)
MQVDQDEITIEMTETIIKDGQLQMMFAVCHPSIPVESQVGLSLRILCGFGIDEIATAFLATKETITKRLQRAKEKLRSGNIKMEFPSPPEIIARLDTVLLTLYLLFNEGYYSESNNAILREDLCKEAMRLIELMLENEKTNQPEVNALYALMCFHASRFDARKNEHGELVLYHDQDESKWNPGLIAKGAYHLNRASGGNNLSRYHLEAGIAYWHTQKSDSIEKWQNILQLYNRLLQMSYSPIAALNRTYALSKVQGKQKAIDEAEKLNLNDNPYYYSLLGELYRGINDTRSKQYFEYAFAVARTEPEREIISRKISTLISQQQNL